MMMMRDVLIACVVALLAGPALAATDQSAVRKAVQTFMQGHTDKLLSRFGKDSRIEYAITALDSRLALADCPAPLQVEARDQGNMSARMNVKVSCTQGNGWSIYVPIDLSVYRPVVVATRPLARGDTVTAGDLQLSEAEVSRSNGQYLSNIEAVVGMDVKRFIAQGSTVQPAQLEPPLMVRRGDAVVVSAESGVVAVKMPGIAMSDGRRGEQIRIKNKMTARVVQAEVVAPGQATVPM